MIHFDEYGNRDNPTILLLHGAAALDTFCGQYGFAEEYHLIVRICTAQENRRIKSRT